MILWPLELINPWICNDLSGLFALFFPQGIEFQGVNCLAPLVPAAVRITQQKLHIIIVLVVPLGSNDMLMLSDIWILATTRSWGTPLPPTSPSSTLVTAASAPAATSSAASLTTTVPATATTAEITAARTTTTATADITTATTTVIDEMCTVPAAFEDIQHFHISS